MTRKWTPYLALAKQMLWDTSDPEQLAEELKAACDRGGFEIIELRKRKVHK